MPLEQIRPSIQLYRDVEGWENRPSPRPNDSDGPEEVGWSSGHGQSARPENMNLLKLGGVGGVTRSGSWGRNQAPSRELLVEASLSGSPEEESGAILAEEDKVGGTTQAEGKVSRTQSSGSQYRQQKAGIDHVRSCSSDVPSSSSRTSTSSYSAAAFSLRSVSNRNSVSSTTSSVASSSRSHTAASEDESTATNTSNRVSQTVPPSSTSTSLTIEEAEPLQASSSDESSSQATRTGPSRVGPEVNRVRSIGRGGSQVERQMETGSEEGEMTAVQGGGDEIPTFAASQHDSSSKPTALAFSQPQFNTFTLSAAAASPVILSSSSSSPFAPPARRRHTGALALRSLSALSQSGAAYGSFSGGGGGRAAARGMTRNSTSYDNAPLSELEARREMTLSSPFRKAAADGSRPTSPFAMQDSMTMSRTGGSPHPSSEWTATRQGSGLVSSSATPSESPCPTGWSRFPESRTPAEGSPKLLEESRDRGAFESTADVEAGESSSSSALFPPSLSSKGRGSSAGLGISADPTSSSRPSLSHSLTGGLVSTNVLRTPTTEEWSRFLAKQGVDPALVAAGNAGRVRTSTGRSNASQRRHNPDRKMSQHTVLGQGFAIPLDARRGSRMSLDSTTGGNEDEERLMDSLRQLGMARTSKGVGAGGALEQELGQGYEMEQDSDGGEEDSSSDERMQALHEAISRPPSRRGTPPRMESPTLEAGETEEYWRIKRPSREAATAAMGYPLPPPGEQRKIDDFVILSDIGRGAYGLVKKAKLKDEVRGKGGESEICIKYIIKSRILADCWRRHKVLGPIPIEIHVMDQLRRLPYKSPSQWPPWSVEHLLDLNVRSPSDSLGHPSLCKMLDFFEDREFYYMVMPCFGKGQDLFDHVESQPHGLSSLQVRCIFGQIADGLQFLHHNNIVHRDVKDENVILDGKGHVQLIDFGSAAHVNKNGRLFDTFSGTLDYAAAEILRGEKYGGKEQDVWALGVVGYVLLCGDCPFWNGEEAIQGLQSDSRAFDVLKERCSTMPTTRLDSDVGLQEEVEKRRLDLAGQEDGGGRIEDAADLIQRCLELDSAKRPSMDAICHHRFLIGHSGWSGPVGWLEQSTATDEPK